MQFHHYHPETGEWLGSALADESPLEPGVWLIPDHATQAEPPAPQNGKVSIWNGTDWLMVTDLRGTRYWLTDGTEHVIKQAGETLPDGALDAPPPASEGELASRARARRDALITETDYLLMRDYPISAGQLVTLQTYRQALRDLPLQPGFPQHIDWPQ